MNDKSLDAIARAELERDRLCQDCFNLLYKISRKPSCIKLLGLAQAHLSMLAEYKSGRGQRRGDG